MKRHALNAAIVWLILTAIGEVLALRADIYPLAAAEEANTVDSAFRFLLLLGVPVFTFVVAALLYSVLRFRSLGDPSEDGPPLRGNVFVTGIWLLVTTGLAVFVIFNPGLKGLAELRDNTTADLVVKAEGSRWFWKISYPQHGIASKEMVLPVRRRVKFEITATDVIHSFWVPAFRMKADAVPGLVTVLYVTPTVVGSFDDDFNLRLQCAELCGLGHDIMHTPVVVMEQAQFDAWLVQRRSR